MRAMILFNDGKREKNQVTLLEFMEMLVKEWIDESENVSSNESTSTEPVQSNICSSRKSLQASAKRFERHHFPEFVSLHKQKDVRKRCKVCSCKCRSFCPNCQPNQVFLCVKGFNGNQDCFRVFHTEKNYL